MKSTLNSMSVPNPSPDDQSVMLKSYVDSGAARSVCPTGFGEQFGLVPAPGSRNGEGFKTATGKRVTNKGGRTIAGHTDFGKDVSMNYAVADINVALDSVSQICDTGAHVIFRKTGGKLLLQAGTELSLIGLGIFTSEMCG